MLHVGEATYVRDRLSYTVPLNTRWTHRCHVGLGMNRSTRDAQLEAFYDSECRILLLDLKVAAKGLFVWFYILFL